MKNTKLSALFFAVIFILLLFLMWSMAKPLLGSIIFAAIITGSLYPLFEKIYQKLRIKREFASILMCLLIALLIFIPTIYIVFQLSKQTIGLYQNLREAIDDRSVHYFLFGDGSFARLIRRAGEVFDLDINMAFLKDRLFEYIESFSAYLFNVLNAWVSNVVTLLFNFVMMILVIYALFTYGDKLKSFILKLSPLPDEQEEHILNKFNQMNYVTLICNGLSGLIQGTLAGIAFWIVGIGSVVLWSSMMVILAFIPMVGISLIHIPACIFLLLKGKTLSAILLFIFCFAVSFVTENWFKPKFIGDRVKVNPIFVLFCIIGGVSVFSVAGIFYGPIIGILFLTFVDIYHKNYS